MNAEQSCNGPVAMRLGPPLPAGLPRFPVAPLSIWVVWRTVAAVACGAESNSRRHRHRALLAGLDN